MGVIYAPKGRAAEFAPLACNLALSCSVGCAYCYAPIVLRRERADFHRFGGARPGILGRIENDAPRFKGRGAVLLSFACDPLQPGLEDLTHKAVEICNRHGVPVILLTKRPGAADMELLARHPGNELWTTVTTLDACTAGRWEPGANTPWARLAMLRLAALKGVRTAVSLEPVIWPRETLRIIQAAFPFTGRFLLGRLNYAGTLPGDLRQELAAVDWSDFRRRAVALLRSVGAKYLIKKDLQEA